jgi:hypothetical protein
MGRPRASPSRLRDCPRTVRRTVAGTRPCWARTALARLRLHTCGKCKQPASADNSVAVAPSQFVWRKDRAPMSTPLSVGLLVMSRSKVRIPFPALSFAVGHRQRRRTLGLLVTRRLGGSWSLSRSMRRKRRGCRVSASFHWIRARSRRSRPKCIRSARACLAAVQS